MFIFAMPYFIALVIASGALWVLACQMAPLGYEVTFARVLTAVILMAACVMMIKSFLASVGGPLPGAAVFLVLATLIVKSTLNYHSGVRCPLSWFTPSSGWLHGMSFCRANDFGM